MDYTKLIRDVPDFPKAGIMFKDITPLLGDAEALRQVFRDMASPFVEMDIDLVIGMESRGFIFGPAVATLLGCGFAPVRKPGRLPFQTKSVTYDLEYGTDSLEIHIDALKPGQRVLIVDDLLATGGTACAAAKLVTQLGGLVSGYSFVIELDFLKGRQTLGETPVNALIHY